MKRFINNIPKVLSFNRAISYDELMTANFFPSVYCTKKIMLILVFESLALNSIKRSTY